MSNSRAITDDGQGDYMIILFTAFILNLFLSPVTPTIEIKLNELFKEPVKVEKVIEVKHKKLELKDLSPKIKFLTEDSYRSK